MLEMAELSVGLGALGALPKSRFMVGVGSRLGGLLGGFSRGGSVRYRDSGRMDSILYGRQGGIVLGICWKFYRGE